MRFYTVHLRERADPMFTPDRDARFVREGFNWGAFLLPLLWVLFTAQWLAAPLLWAAWIAVFVALDWLGLDGGSALAVLFAFHFGLGLTGNDIRRWSLARKGYRMTAVVGARTLAAAETRYFDAAPSGSAA